MKTTALLGFGQALTATAFVGRFSVRPLLALRRPIVALLLCAGVLGNIIESLAAQPISVCPHNPHYYFYRNKPVVLITSAEHYGSVINREFNYVRYLNMLQSYKLNYTRIYPGYLIEPQGLYVEGNTLAPKPESLLLPWARGKEPGYILGGNKFDLSAWDKLFFQRLHDFVKAAEARDIIVEICFFNAQSAPCWELSPLNSRNNCQGIGRCHFNDAQTLKDAALVKAEADYVRKIVREINNHDNVILEVSDETTVHGTPLDMAADWTRYMIALIKKTERSLPKKHLIAQQVMGVLNGPGDLSDHKDVGVVVGQYVGVQFYGDGRATYHDAVQEGGIQALDDKYHCNKPIEFNETYYYPLDYKGDAIADSRVEAWEFIVGGGAGFNHLNSRYTVAQPDGDTPDNRQILGSLRNLNEFIQSVDFVNMRPDKQLLVPNSPSDYVFWRAIGKPGQQYALYLHHSFLEYSAYTVKPGKYKTSMELRIPPGTYVLDWVNPETGTTCRTERIENHSDTLKLAAPEHQIDIALRITRIQ